MGYLNVLRCIFIVIAFAFTSNVSANLCRDKHISVRDTLEAAHLATLNFADGSYAGNKDYNALIIGCNRKRDSREKMIEESFEPTKKFSKNLSARLIKGKINYYGKFPVRYGYELERVDGEWIVTIPLKFNFETPSYPPRYDPNSQTPKPSDTLDISIELAKNLGLVTTGGICDDSSRNSLKEYEVNGIGFILRIGGEDSCRLSKNFSIDGKSIQKHLANFWTKSINDFWTRDNIFKVKAKNYDDLTSSQQSRYLKAKAYWKIEFNSKPQTRATYSPVVGKFNPLYSGEAKNIIIHEVGHALGLDDEYREGSNKPWRVCSDRGGSSYVMCQMPPTSTYVKDVYSWIITRRYYAETCKQDSDCSASEYCASGAFIKNHCKKKGSDGDKCSSNRKCGAGLFCVNKPVGSCIFENSLSLDDSCRVNEQCTTGKCQGTGNDRQCVCDIDSHCPSGSYCRNRPGKNECRILHGEYSSCSSDNQCAQGLTCNHKPAGHCINISSKSIDQKCEYNNECSTDKCQGSGADKICVCDFDSHCGAGEYCNNRLKQNRCLADASKLVGTSCDKNDECSSGKCQAGECVCNFDSDCGTGEYCNNRLKQNRCLVDAGKSIGQSCEKNRECATDKCEGSQCVCKSNSDCPGSQKCKTPVWKGNYCK